MTKTLHELAKEMLNKANVEVLTETGKLKKEEPAKDVQESMKKSPLHAGPKVDVKKMDAVGDKIAKIRGSNGDPAKDGIAAAKKDDEERNNIKEDEIDESTRKHFQQVADVIKAHPDAAKRKELAQHHSEIFAKQNPRFDKKKFHAASNAELDEGVNGEHGPDDDEDQLDRIERKKQAKAPFKPDKKPSSNWTSAKNKAKNLARAAMKKQVEKKKVNEDKIKPDSKIKVAGKYLFGNTKGNVAHIEGDKTKKLGEDDVNEISVQKLDAYVKKADEQLKKTDDDNKITGKRAKGLLTAWKKLTKEEVAQQTELTATRQRKLEAKNRVKEMRGKRKKEPYLPFGKKALPRHTIDKAKLTETELAELSKETLQKYKDTSSLEIGKAKAKKAWAQHDAKRDPSPENYQKQNDAEHAIQKRTKGQELVKKKLGEEDIVELSKKTLGSYKRKALEYIGNHHERGKKNKKVSNKVTGIDRAQNRLLSK